MARNEYRFSYEELPGFESLTEEDRNLLAAAREVSASAYAPYSRFQVGAVARLENGAIVKGTNQENASFPVGLCAERVLLSSVVSQYGREPIQTIAIAYKNGNPNALSNLPVSPCGVCRQSLHQTELMQAKPIRLILSGMEGPVQIIDSAGQLLPFGFTL